jgi:uncharacterized protein (TIGR02466 family)
MQPIQLFEHLIWKGHYDGDLTGIKERIQVLFNTSTKLNSGLERDGGVSSSSDPSAPHTWKESIQFLNWLIEPTAQVWQHWGFPEAALRVVASWANRHPTGAWTEEHQHRSVPLVAVLYVDQPDSGGNLEICDPLFYHWNYSMKPSGDNWREIKVQTGDILIFPGWINHRTQKNQSDQDRYVISFNVIPG